MGRRVLLALGAIDTAFAPVLDSQVESLAVAPDGLHVFAGGSFTKINEVAQKSLVKLRLSDGARITAFKGKTNARVKDMAVSGAASTSAAPSRPSTRRPHRPGRRRPGHRALSNDVNLAFTGPRTGTVSIDKFDISPDGSRLIAIGNWTYVAGLQRDQIVMLNLATTPVSVTDWATTRFQQQCASVFDTYMRDVDISPDGGYLVIGTTGAYRAGSLCDAASRLGAGPDRLRPAADLGRLHRRRHPLQRGHHRPAVYVGDHRRRMNNSFAADRAGPGAVAREGIAALDPINGLPLSWNPGRDRPLAGGTPVPESRVGTLPGDLFRIGTDNTMTRRAFTGTGVGAPSTVTTGVDWSTVRGAFVVSGASTPATPTAP